MKSKMYGAQLVETEAPVYVATQEMTCNDPRPTSQCRQLPGTLIRIFIPAGAVINLLNLIELSSPSGICLIVRIPILGGTTGGASAMSSLIQQVQQAGGTFELVQ
jgi:hypothetical protein